MINSRLPRECDMLQGRIKLPGVVASHPRKICQGSCEAVSIVWWIQIGRGTMTCSKAESNCQGWFKVTHGRSPDGHAKPTHQFSLCCPQ